MSSSSHVQCSLPLRGHLLHSLRGSCLLVHMICLTSMNSFILTVSAVFIIMAVLFYLEHRFNWA